LSFLIGGEIMKKTAFFICTLFATALLVIPVNYSWGAFQRTAQKNTSYDDSRENTAALLPASTQNYLLSRNDLRVQGVQPHLKFAYHNGLRYSRHHKGRAYAYKHGYKGGRRYYPHTYRYPGSRAYGRGHYGYSPYKKVYPTRSFRSHRNYGYYNRGYCK
jgi:hypothetical protein